MSACLLLNASFEPMAPLLSLPRAVRLVITGKATVVESDGRVVRSGAMEIPRPVVIQLSRYVVVPVRHRRSVTNTILFGREAYRCGFCGRHQRDFGPREFLTRDHVVPLSRGGQNSWQNCVTACHRCNNRKADRTPKEAGMPLQSWVRLEPPKAIHLRWPVRRLTPLQQKYIAMYFGEETLDSLR